MNLKPAQNITDDAFDKAVSEARDAALAVLVAAFPAELNYAGMGPPKDYKAALFEAISDATLDWL